MNLDRFSRPLPGEGKWRCEECGASVPAGERLCEACREAYWFDRHEDDYKLGLLKCAYSWLNKEGDV